MPTQQKLKYPYNWGRTVVQEFIERYGRGSYFLAKLLDITPGEVRHGLIMRLCRGDQIRFEAIKRMIKLLSDYSAEEIKRFSAEERKLLYKYYLYLCENEVLDEKDSSKAIDITLNKTLDL